MNKLVVVPRLVALVTGSLVLYPFGLLSRLPALFGARDTAARWGARVQQVWCRVNLLCMGVRIVTDGEPPEGCFLIAANHVSYVDISVLGAIFPGRFVAKSEIAGWPAIGLLAKSVGTIFVDQSKRRDVLRVGEVMDRTLALGVSVFLFPEAGASRGARIEPFKSSLLAGPAREQIPCLPVVLRYESDAPWGEAWTVCWWGGMGLWPHVLRLLGLGGVRARVRWAPAPIVQGDRKVLGAELRAAMEELFEPVSQEDPPPDFPWPHLLPDAAEAEAT